MDVDRERVEQRADGLLPEELAAGSDDPFTQAETILQDSEQRTADVLDADPQQPPPASRSTQVAE